MIIKHTENFLETRKLGNFCVFRDFMAVNSEPRTYYLGLEKSEPRFWFGTPEPKPRFGKNPNLDNKFAVWCLLPYNLVNFVFSKLTPSSWLGSATPLFCFTVSRQFCFHASVATQHSLFSEEYINCMLENASIFFVIIFAEIFCLEISMKSFSKSNSKVCCNIESFWSCLAWKEPCSLLKHSKNETCCS